MFPDADFPRRPRLAGCKRQPGKPAPRRFETLPSFIIEGCASYFWSDKNMIRFLQKSGQTTKYVLGGLLLIICASMVITLIPGGLGGEVFGFGGAPGKGVVAKVGGEDITTDEVRQTARQMLQQQMPQGSSG